MEPETRYTSQSEPDTSPELEGLSLAVSRGYFCKPTGRIQVALSAPVYDKLKAKSDELGTDPENAIAYLVHRALGLDPTA